MQTNQSKGEQGHLEVMQVWSHHLWRAIVQIGSCILPTVGNCTGHAITHALIMRTKPCSSKRLQHSSAMSLAVIRICALWLLAFKHALSCLGSDNKENVSGALTI